MILPPWAVLPTFGCRSTYSDVFLLLEADIHAYLPSHVLHWSHQTASFFCVFAKMHLCINSFYLFLI